MLPGNLIKSFIVLAFFLAVAGNCNAGTYTSKSNPQHSVQYEEADQVYFTVGQCENYSRQNYPEQIVSCRSTVFRHFYLNGEIVDDRMDEMAKNSGTEDAFLFMLVLIFALILSGVVIYVYMIPTFTAYKRKHPQRVYIMLLNLFLGNTLVGWIAALIWARGGGENKND